MKHNAKNRAPPTQPWFQSLVNRPDAAPLRPHRLQVAKHMVEGDVGGDSGCRVIFSGG